MKQMWRFVFCEGVKFRISSREIKINHDDRTYVFTNDNILLTFIDLIKSEKLTLPIFSTPNTIVSKFLELGLLKVQFLDQKKLISELNYFPSISKAKKRRNAAISIAKFQIEISKNSAIVQSRNLEKEIKFFNKSYLFFVLENKKNSRSLAEKVMGDILSGAEFAQGTLTTESWDYHDLLFHEKTCITNPNFRPSKTEKPLTSKSKILKMQSQTQPLVKRRSVRRFSEKPIAFAKLSRLLWNIGRKKPSKHSFYGQHYQGSYPSAGGAYENEFYLLAGNCAKLQKGLYRYDGLKHELIDLKISESDLKALLSEAGSKVRDDKNLNLNAIIVTSKIDLLKKKYSKVVYRLALLNAGVIIGYLDFFVSKLNLGGCPTGSIDWKAFAKIVNKDGYKEFAVAEYLIGEIKSNEKRSKY